MGRGKWRKNHEQESGKRMGRGRHARGSDEEGEGGGQEEQRVVAVLIVPKERKGGCGKGKLADEGDPDTKARRNAKKDATKLVRDAIEKQRNFIKIPKFTLRIVADNKKLQLAIQKFFSERYVSLRGVQSTDCRNVPVTPPHYCEGDDESDDANMRIDEIAYHILVFVGLNENLEPLEALVQYHDGYIIAIRPQPTDDAENDGWFACSDVDLPEDLFGTRNWKMNYDTGYSDQQNIEMGNGSLNKMVNVLLGINEANCKVKTPERERMLNTLKVFGGEMQRIAAILRFFLVNVDSDPWVPLNGLSFWTNHWRKLGDAILHLILALLAEEVNVCGSKKDTLLIEGGLRKAAAMRCLKGFEGKNIPVTVKGFLDSIPHGLLRRMMPAALEYLSGHKEHLIAEASSVAAREEEKLSLEKDGSSSSVAVTEEELSLDLLLTYIMLIKYENTLVPELIMRRTGNSSAFEVKLMEDEENKEEKKVVDA